jgi:hypothetical protein
MLIPAAKAFKNNGNRQRPEALLELSASKRNIAVWPRKMPRYTENGPGIGGDRVIQ